MNQAFRHNFNVGKEDATRPEQGHTGMADPKDNYTEAGHNRNICFVWLDGKKIFLNYSYLISGEFSPSEGSITLNFTSHAFIIAGLNLEALFYDIMNQITRQVVCIDRRYNDIQEENQPIVNEIRLKISEWN